MTCSKIFSGDLPELTYGVIKYFQNDFSTLHSCILVNRLWCRLAIPLLWENPFSIPTTKYKFIDIYFHNLNDEFKTKLNEYKVINNSLNSNTLFNYPMFLKYLNMLKFISSVKSWLSTDVKASYSESKFHSIWIDTCVSLFKIFIENEVNLHTLEIELLNTYLDNITELILKNINSIHNIKNLDLHILNSNENMLKNHISQMVNSQNNLKRMLFSTNGLRLWQSLLLSNDYNCSNTLNTIIFYYVDFKGIINLDKTFEQLNVLESIHIVNCCSLNAGFTQQISNLTKPFKLKSLFINRVSKIESLQIESLQILLQKSGDYLENFGYDHGYKCDLSLKQQLLELITKYYKNAKFLCLFSFESQMSFEIFNLVENIKQSLNYLSIGLSKPSLTVGDSAIILQNLGQILPSKLEFLSLSLDFRKNDFRVFLENSQNTFINKLVIMQSYSDNITYCIKEFIMKKKRVNYLAIRHVNNDLSDLKDEVSEFKLYNVEVRNYHDLHLSFNIYSLIKKIDYL
ncbi:unnamed protein product [Rhizophagus irregularis]|nr:unnamed protein product [Rhizophagus irregularis]